MNHSCTIEHWVLLTYHEIFIRFAASVKALVREHYINLPSRYCQSRVSNTLNNPLLIGHEGIGKLRMWRKWGQVLEGRLCLRWIVSVQVVRW